MSSSTSAWAADPGEHLTTGWERSTESSDTLVRSYLDSFAAMCEEGALDTGGRTYRDERVLIADTGAPAAILNMAVLLAPIHDIADPLLEVITEFFADGQGGPWLLLSATPTPDLRPLGLALVGHPPMMLRMPGAAPRPAPEDLEIIEANNAETLREIDRAAIDFYPFPELHDVEESLILPAAMLERSDYRCYLGRVGGESVGTSIARLSPAITQVELVTSSPRHRGRGYGAAMTWAATSADATKPAMLIASDAGQPTYQRMGYVPILRAAMWAGTRPGLEER